MSLGVLWEYVKSLFASSPCTHRFFPRFLRLRIDNFGAYGEVFLWICVRSYIYLQTNVLVNDLFVISLHRFSCHKLKALFVIGILFRTLNTNILSQTVYKMSEKLIHIWTSSGFSGVFSIYVEILSASSLLTYKFFTRIIHWRQDSFRVFSVHA